MQPAPVDLDAEQLLEPHVAEVDVRAEVVEQRELAALVRRLERDRAVAERLDEALRMRAVQLPALVEEADAFGALARLDDELHGTGVGVSTVSPGFIRDAGMFAESGVKLPPGVGTKTPDDVARAVVGAIEKGRADIDVAPVTFKFGGRISNMAPSLIAALNRRLGSEKVGKAMAEGQADKR